MSGLDLKTFIRNNLFHSRGINPSKVKQCPEEIKHEIFTSTQKCKSDNIIERIVWILNDWSDYPKICPTCNQPITKFCSATVPYKETYCSHSCRSRGKEWNDKRKQTLLERHGSETYNNRSGAKQTCEERYGVSHHNKNPEIKKKGTDTMIERYGGSGPMNSPILRARITKTNQERYGVEFPFQNKNIQQKVEESNLQNHGNRFFMSTPEFRIKSRQSLMDRYGVESNMHVPEYLDRRDWFSQKQYTFPSGKIVRVQGNEPKALDLLLE